MPAPSRSASESPHSPRAARPRGSFSRRRTSRSTPPSNRARTRSPPLDGCDSMALVGSLRDLSLPELLAIISNGEKSGIITIRSDAATAQIHVDEGRIVLASDTLRDERFGEIMMKLGKISQDTLNSALESQETAG